MNRKKINHKKKNPPKVVLWKKKKRNKEIGKCLARFTKKMERNEKKDITTEFTETSKLINSYNKQNYQYIR